MDNMFFPVHDASVNLSAGVSALSDFVLVGCNLWVLFVILGSLSIVWCLEICRRLMDIPSKAFFRTSAFRTSRFLTQLNMAMKSRIKVILSVQDQTLTDDKHARFNYIKGFTLQWASDSGPAAVGSGNDGSGSDSDSAVYE